MLPEGMLPHYPPLGPPPLGFLLPVVLPPGSCRLRAAGVWDVGLRVAGLRAAGVQDAILGVARLQVAVCVCAPKVRPGDRTDRDLVLKRKYSNEFFFICLDPGQSGHPSCPLPPGEMCVFYKHRTLADF